MYYIMNKGGYGTREGALKGWVTRRKNMKSGSKTSKKKKTKYIPEPKIIKVSNTVAGIKKVNDYIFKTFFKYYDLRGYFQKQLLLDPKNTLEYIESMKMIDFYIKFFINAQFENIKDVGIKKSQIYIKDICKIIKRIKLNTNVC